MIDKYDLITWSDAFIVPIWFIIILLFFSFRISKYESSNVRLILIGALGFKIVIVIVRLLLLFLVFEQRADTVTYYKGSRFLYNLYWENIHIANEIIFCKIENLSAEALSIIRPTRHLMLNVDHAPGIVVRLTALLSLICKNSYIALCLIYSSLAFYGSILLFDSFRRLYPHLQKKGALSLFIPSVVFWGSLVSKDSLMLFGMGLFVFYLSEIVYHKRLGLLNILFMCFGALILFKIKAYVLIAALVSLLFSLVFTSIRIKENSVKILFIFVLLFISSGVLFKASQGIEKHYSKVGIESIEHRSETMIVGTERGESQYKLLWFSLTPQGVILGSVSAIFTTYFRPFIWETKKIIYLPSIVEGFLFLAFFIYVFLKTNLIWNVRKLLYRDKPLMFYLMFSILFGILAGLFSLTFGSLVRYKIPSLVFFYFSLLIILDKHKYIRGSLAKRFIEHRVLLNPNNL